jgi:methylenetetrahydrofolate dehydrogenase (NADP+) / methenyltetrahydrofolate cyclohydrolase
VTAQIIDGKAIAAKVRAQVKERVGRFTGVFGYPPGLEVVLVGDDPASQVYVRNKEKAAHEADIRGVLHRLPADTSQAGLAALVEKLNADDRVDGILVQLPLPKHLDPAPILTAIDPRKDVDGLHPVSAGLMVAGKPGLRPCTPLGCMRLLEEVGCNPEGKRAVVIGRSNLVGKPAALMLLDRNATVTMAHSRTADLAGVVGEADIVVAAVGKAGLVKGEWIKPGAIVIDVGTNRGADGKLVGDVEFAAARERAAWITPVPGGVGPMTIAMLLSNCVLAAEMRATPVRS